MDCDLCWDGGGGLDGAATDCRQTFNTKSDKTTTEFYHVSLVNEPPRLTGIKLYK